MPSRGSINPRGDGILAGRVVQRARLVNDGVARDVAALAQFGQRILIGPTLRLSTRLEHARRLLCGHTLSDALVILEAPDVGIIPVDMLAIEGRRVPRPGKSLAQRGPARL